MEEPRQGRFTGYIQGKLYEELDHHGHPFEQEEQPEDVKIVAEISARMLDLKDQDRRKPVRLLNQFLRLYRVRPSCLWLACEILACNRQGGKSLAQLAKEVHFSKQAVHQSHVRDLDALDVILPGVSDQMRRILGRFASINEEDEPEDEESK